MRPILIIAQLTVQESQRRRILWMALIMGALFLLVFGLGFHYIYVEIEEAAVRPGGPTATVQDMIRSFMLLFGLYAVNFLGIVITALLSAGIISSEIESHTIETLLTKPVRRAELVVGKWMGLALIVAVYIAALALGVIAIVTFRSGTPVESVGAALALMILSALTMLSLTILGGTRLTTLANGALAFMLYAVAFIGGWVEQFGALLRNETAVDLGIVSSLLMPADAIWKQASLLFQPGNQGILDGPTPLFVVSRPNDLMTFYAVVYVVVLLGLALWSFSRRDL